MRILYIDCNMGASGDMIMGALLELVEDRKSYIEKINNLFGGRVTVIEEPCIKCGILGTHVSVSIDGTKEQSTDYHGCKSSISECCINNKDYPQDEQCYEAHSHEEHANGKGCCEEHSHEGHVNCEWCHEEHRHEEHVHGKRTNIECSHVKYEHLDYSHDENINIDYIKKGHNHAEHSSLEDVIKVIEDLELPSNVINSACEIYKNIAQAEASVHGTTPSEVHFHEVGSIDAIVDIVGTVLLIEELRVDKIVSSSITTGFGNIKCAHGVLPVPAPATAKILLGIPIRAGDINGELCTPTGAALVTYYAQHYASGANMVVDKIGYGMGTKDYPIANCVRVMLGHEMDDSKDYDAYNRISNGLDKVDVDSHDKMYEICCNIDDMTAEEIGYATEVLIDNGALDVYTSAIGMKKSRLGTKLSVICDSYNRVKLEKIIFEHTSTLGIREHIISRVCLDRRIETVNSIIGGVKVKYASGCGINRYKLEYDDLSRIAKEKGISIMKVKEIISKEIR